MLSLISTTIEQTISEFHNAITLPPEMAAESCRGLGKAHAKIGNVLKAIEHYTKYLELRPQANNRLEIEAETHHIEKLPDGKSTETERHIEEKKLRHRE